MTKKIKILLLMVLFFGVAGIITLDSARANYPSLVTGQKNVTTKGTPVQLTSVVVKDNMHLVVKAANDNTEKITVGYSSATALNSGTGWFSLYPGESVELLVTNANLVWIDGASGEGIEYITEAD